LFVCFLTQKRNVVHGVDRNITSLLGVDGYLTMFEGSSFEEKMVVVGEFLLQKCNTIKNALAVNWYWNHQLYDIFEIIAFILKVSK